MDTPVNYYDAYQPFGPVGPKPKWTCENHFQMNWDRATCSDCVAYKRAIQAWMVQATTEDCCGAHYCGHCFDGWHVAVSNIAAIENRHFKWLNAKPTARNPNPVCPTCRCESWLYCNCRWCPNCEKVALNSERCPNCHAHTTCNACTCVRCPSCDTPIGAFSACAACECCMDCCSCVSCSHCANRYTSEDEMCEHDICSGCRGWGRCLPCDGVKYFQCTDAKHLTDDRLKFKVNPVHRLLGVEIETSAHRWPTVAKVVEKWGGGIVHDGSIIPVVHDGEKSIRGFEITLAPAMGDLFVQQVAEITDALATDEARVNTSCGVHVHVDASSYKWWDVQKLIKLYHKLEPALFAVLAPYRARSPYAKPCADKYMDEFIHGIKDVKGLKAKLLRGIYEIDVTVPENKNNRRMKARLREGYNHKYNENRYHALNIHSWFRRGTIEFRHHHGTLSKATITNWAILCGSIVSAAERLSDAEIQKLTAKSALATVLTTDAVADWYKRRVRYMKTMHNAALDEQEETRCDDCGNPRFTAPLDERRTRDHICQRRYEDEDVDENDEDYCRCDDDDCPRAHA